MADDTTVIIDILVEDNSSNSIEHITNNVVHLHQAVQREEKQESRWHAALQRGIKLARSAAGAIARAATSVAKLAALTGPATTGLLAAGKALAVVGKAAANLTPLLAFLPSLIGSLKLVKTTLTLMGPGLAKAFEPFLVNFRDSKGEASAFTKRLQDIAGIGLKPLVAEFNRLNLPAIQRGMEGVAYQVNGLTNHTLRWLNTTNGQLLIKNITLGTVKAMESLTPKLLRVVNAFGSLAAKAGDKAIVNLGAVIGRIVDKIATWAEQHDLDDINAALGDLAGYGGKLKSTFTAIRDIGRWLASNQDVIRKFSDAAAAGAVALGAATGNIPAVIAGVVSLIVNHWNQLKPYFTGAVGWVRQVFTAWQHDASRIKIADAILRALNGMKAGFEGATREIGPKWAKFTAQLSEAWSKWAPLLEVWWNTSGRQVFAFIGTAIGVFVIHLLEMATIAAAVVGAIAGSFKWLVHVVLEVFGALINGAAKAFSWVPDLGPKLNIAAQQFNAFKDKVNSALSGIDPIKTIRINASVYVTGNNSAAGGVDQRTGNSRNAGLSGLTSWQRVAAAAFAGERESTSRTGGPTPLVASVSNTVLLDGQPFRRYADRAVFESERRTAWNAKNRRK